MRKLIPHDAVLIPGEAKRVFEGVIYDVYQWPQAMFDGTQATFEMLKRPDTVSSLCIVDDKIVVLSDEQPHRGERLTFPGGRVDPEDASPLKAVQREVLEETGYSFAEWKLVHVGQPATKIEWFIHLYVATKPTQKIAPHTDGGEKISAKFMTFDQAKDLCLNKVGYLGESEAVFRVTSSIADVLALPEFSGRAVDR